MLREICLRILSRLIVKTMRGLFRLPNWAAAPILLAAHKTVKAARLPQEAVGYTHDAYCAMRDGPPLSVSLRRLILDSDPVMIEDVLFNAMRGDPPLKEVDPWE